jgi:hypothetical protein
MGAHHFDRCRVRGELDRLRNDVPNARGEIGEIGEKGVALHLDMLCRGRSLGDQVVVRDTGHRGGQVVGLGEVRDRRLDVRGHGPRRRVLRVSAWTLVPCVASWSSPLSKSRPDRKRRVTVHVQVRSRATTTASTHRGP